MANGSELFDNWIEQLRAWVKEERNHPSILIWSIENEITFINSRNLGLYKTVEPQIARGAREVAALDPTRPVMVDGGHCLVDESLPVNGVHYQEGFWRDYPDEAYTLAKAYVAHEQPVISWGKVLWRLVPDRPIFMGESYYVRGNNPAAFSQFGGEGCFTGWGLATQRGAGLLAKMLAEGYRWHGVAAQHFWFGSEDAALHYNSWRPVCVLCRQWNWTFGGGSTVTRTLKLCNDTHASDPIEMAWQLQLEDKVVAGRKATFSLGPGQHEEVEISCAVPPVSKRTAGQFILTCSRHGKEVFREVKTVAVLDPGEGPKPSLAAAQLVVIDPQGTAKARLRSRGIAFTEAQGVTQVPAQCRVVLLGQDALSSRDATDPHWLALAARGTRLLALEQAHPLHFQALPADLSPTNYVGRVAFMENPEHPAFAGLTQADFFTWSGNHVVYRNVYKKATRGAISLAHCDEQLGYSAIAECPVNEGLMVLCQMVVGEKLASDPVAQRLFDNLLSYCADYALVQKHTAVVMDAKGPTAKLLADAGWKYSFTIAYGKGEPLAWTMELPKEEEIVELSILPSPTFNRIAKIKLAFDGGAPITLELAGVPGRQDLPVPPHKARRLGIELVPAENGKRLLVGVDNLRIRVTRPADFNQRVRPLLNLGAMVKYPMGAGGVILNQLRAIPNEAVPVNAQKKQVIAATLLRNLHATFAGGRILTATNLQFQPLPLEEQCNQYLTKDRGWFGGGRDVSHVPIGKQDFCGVSYMIRDFRTSPLPSCVMLAGPGARGKLPPAVNGLKAGCKADVLYFLHAFNRTGEWRRQRTEQPTPILFKYVVHYADGQTADVPVPLARLLSSNYTHLCGRNPISYHFTSQSLVGERAVRQGT